MYFESPPRITSFPFILTWRLELRSAERASSESLSVLLRERSTRRATCLRTTGQVPDSGIIWTYVAIEPSSVSACIYIRESSSWKSPRPPCKLEHHKRSMMLRPSEQVRWSLRLFLRQFNCCVFIGTKSTAFRRLHQREMLLSMTAYYDLAYRSFLISKVFVRSSLLVSTF